MYLTNGYHYSCGWNPRRETLIGEWMNHTPLPIAEGFVPPKRAKASAQEDSGKRALEREHGSREAQKSQGSDESSRNGKMQQMDTLTILKTCQFMGTNPGSSFLKLTEESSKYGKSGQPRAPPLPKTSGFVSTNTSSAFLRLTEEPAIKETNT